MFLACSPRARRHGAGGGCRGNHDLLPGKRDSEAVDGLGDAGLGHDGTPASNVAAVPNAIVRLSAADAGDLISGLDMNPLIAGPSGCVAVDVLVAREYPRLANGAPPLCCTCVTPAC